MQENEEKARTGRARPAWPGRLVRWFLGLGVLALATVAAGLAGVYLHLAEDLPRIDSLGDYRPPIISSVYADDGRKIGEFYSQRRIVVGLDRIPLMLQNAFIAAEDSRFHQHRGIDLLGILRAFFKNIEAGTIVQGGSTITQQVTKSFLLTPERSYTRKIKEAILAYRIDKAFSKEEILFLYLNQIYLGHGAYGVAAAAENYFGKSVDRLDLAECAMLAGLPQAPSRYSPFRHPDRARQRQIYVLGRMVDEGMIRADQAKAAIDTTLEIKPRRNWFFEEVPVYTEHVRRYVIERYGEPQLLEDGLQIHTAVNVDLQKVASLEAQKGLGALDRRRGYRGSIDHLEPEAVNTWISRRAGTTAPAEGETVEAVVTGVDHAAATLAVHLGYSTGFIGPEDFRWAQAGKKSRALKPGDLVLVRIKGAVDSDKASCVLEQVPETEAALLCMEAASGQVKAMVGGRDFTASQFNRAIQSRRQPGSAFKPIIYAAAIDKGFTPASVLIDSPVVFHDRKHDMTWKPQNYGQKFYGLTTLRQALAQSRNVVTVKLLREIGVAYVIDYARKLGIESPLEPNLSIALGSSGVSLLELVRAYAIFANRGERVEPVFVTRIVDRDGRVLEESRVERRPVIAPSTAYIMTSLLESVVQEGTGSRVKALNRPVAGKTGTTDDLHDAWFVGFTTSHVTGVWVGLDDEATLGKGETGARAASPIWLGFMRAVVAEKPAEVFRVPEGVVFTRIDTETGLLPIAESKQTRFECFKEGTEPTTYTSRPDEIVRPESFYKSDI